MEIAVLKVMRPGLAWPGLQAFSSEVDTGSREENAPTR
jgi:hypothetical protein